MMLYMDIIHLFLILLDVHQAQYIYFKHIPIQIANASII